MAAVKSAGKPAAKKAAAKAPAKPRTRKPAAAKTDGAADLQGVEHEIQAIISAAAVAGGWDVVQVESCTDLARKSVKFRKELGNDEPLPRKSVKFRKELGNDEPLPPHVTRWL